MRKLIIKLREVAMQMPQNYNDQLAQKHLFFLYNQLRNSNLPLPDFREASFRVYSQMDEDGILLYIYSLIGFSNKILVDVAFGEPYGSNSTNLICNWGFQGLLIDSHAKMVNEAKRFFRLNPNTKICPPKIINVWLTQENINNVLKENNISGQIDLFCLDIDGVDYWIWKSLKEITPRVVVVETQMFWGKKKAVTVPYKADFNRFDIHPDYFGASIPAFIKLGREKGYRPVACNHLGYNIFFVRDDIARHSLPEITAEKCFENINRELQQELEKRLKAVENLKWLEV